MATIDDANKQLEQIVLRATAPLDDATLRELGREAVNMMQLRTKRSLDVDQRAFVKYSPSYSLVRERSGYSNLPDLVRTGHMLGSIDSKVTGKDTVTIAFNSEAESAKGGWHNYGTRRGIPQREFFGIRADAEVRVLGEVIEEALQSRIDRMK